MERYKSDEVIVIIDYECTLQNLMCLHICIKFNIIEWNVYHIERALCEKKSQHKQRLFFSIISHLQQRSYFVPSEYIENLRHRVDFCFSMDMFTRVVSTCIEQQRVNEGKFIKFAWQFSNYQKVKTRKIFSIIQNVVV